MRAIVSNPGSVIKIFPVQVNQSLTVITPTVTKNGGFLFAGHVVLKLYCNICPAR